MSAVSLSIKNVSWKAHRSKDLVLDDISLSVKAGQVLGVVGANGAGKSTLLRMIYRFNRPTTGTVEIDGDDIWSLPPRAVARKVAAVLQEQPTDFALSVREIVALGRTPFRAGLVVGSARDSAIIDATLDGIGLRPLAHRPFGTLSGGERQRVMVARALAQQPGLLVLDEPTNHLDIRHQLEVIALIRHLDMTIVVSLHDLNMAASVCDQILLLDKGRSACVGHPDKVLTEQSVSNAFSVDAHLEELSPSSQSHFTYHLPS
ncbi:ABC transporter ATP-binding protein [uncultured Cohaesibacter sp.]|uniref:ABC transporter ATP-binding protein n=1 Tax=uncultured Cohaesibacter sp. TaxID=1002546 RepID=UPI0029C66D12|nr:ABC transporter ATP-binding protein [uncultured Cohaesibacter sp.]